ncbi:hypothetical protein [Nostoc sp. 'Lobaria pulmonaria (5183) cyanobiont']|uniref:hypothetical protein n=1 Tax=Nostoc sp. 'Lobaria pulmonaria (5183) cyanobiont' TaxID=1618022 RepID=UPI000CF2FFA5|nr:hypothetical protein [Nostoc sp. 'Lobaria pulmonaria (5183) cyanobiont']AVH71131.1 hypothetical protein NLP_2450 [Nostoc sp. 'Lobaria pulmonaria (5183) cyanobiont']
MTYFEQLHPWCIIRKLSSKDSKVIARFRRHNDATAYLQVLQKQMANVKLVVKFNSPTEIA